MLPKDKNIFYYLFSYHFNLESIKENISFFILYINDVIDSMNHIFV